MKKTLTVCPLLRDWFLGRFTLLPPGPIQNMICLLNRLLDRFLVLLASPPVSTQNMIRHPDRFLNLFLQPLFHARLWDSILQHCANQLQVSMLVCWLDLLIWIINLLL